jgi:hypothetical protein
MVIIMNVSQANTPFSLSTSALFFQGNITDNPWNESRNSNKSVPTTSSFCTSPLETHEELKITLFVYYIVFMFLAILGNTLIIYIVFSNKSIRTSTNIFIVNLAVCDHGIPFFLLPKKIAELFVGRYVWLIHGETGLALCKIVPFVYDVFIDCSTFSLLLITFDRFCAVLLPHKRHLLSTKVVAILICLTWLVSISMVAVFLKIFHIVQANGKIICVDFWSDPKAYSAYFITLICTNIVAPIVLITAAYSAIFFKLKKQALILGDSISDQLRQQEYLRQKKIVKMAFAIVCAFAVCWLPFAMTAFIMHAVFDSSTYTCSLLVLHYV